MKMLLPTRKYCVVHQARSSVKNGITFPHTTKIVAPGTISVKLSDGGSRLCIFNADPHIFRLFSVRFHLVSKSHPLILYKSIPRDSVPCIIENVSCSISLLPTLFFQLLFLLRM